MIADLGKTYNLVELFFKVGNYSRPNFFSALATMMINVIPLDEGMWNLKVARS
jgi:hypothetical protein